MASKVEIINLALSRLGVARISSLSDNTTPAKHMSAIYDLAAEDVMSLGWPSNIVRADLAQINETPAYEFTYSYQLPTNPRCLRVLSINEVDYKPGAIQYKIEGTKLLTNDSAVQIKYLCFLSNTEAYDTYLRQAITNKLIAYSAYTFAGSEKLASAFIQAAEREIDVLQSIAGIPGSSDDVPSDDYIDIRREG